MATPGTRKTLVVLLGPTGVGKTAASIGLARYLNTAILSCDSRQVYKEMNIGTAAPGPDELAAVPHYFVRTIPVTTRYNCWEFARQALDILDELFSRRDVALAAGGSMLYIDALCGAIDEIPDVDPATRDAVARLHEREGAGALREMLRELDPAYYRQVDLDNTRRVMHAIEVCLASGKPYSSLRSGRRQQREFDVVKIGLQRDREELYDRINARVDRMVADGMEEEARALYPLRHLNALNAVGYREWFDYFDGKVSREEAIRLVKRNTRRYARKQLSWFRRDNEISWFHPSETERIIAFAGEKTR